MSAIKDRAHAFRHLIREEAFIDLRDGLRQAQISTFCNADATMDEIKQAHDMVVALEKIDEYIQAVFDDEKVYDKKYN